MNGSLLQTPFLFNIVADCLEEFPTVAVGSGLSRRKVGSKFI